MKACNSAVSGDLGHFPLYITTSIRCLKYWIRLLKMPEHQYVTLCYNKMKLYDSIGYFNWVTKLRQNLFSNGFGYIRIWDAQFISNKRVFLHEYMTR